MKAVAALRAGRTSPADGLERRSCAGGTRLQRETQAQNHQQMALAAPLVDLKLRKRALIEIGEPRLFGPFHGLNELSRAN